MRRMYRNIMSGIIVALLVATAFGVGQPVNAQEQSAKEILFDRLRAERKLGIIAEKYPGKTANDITGIEFTGDPEWVSVRFSLDKVTTTEADSPLIIAEQYSTNCTSGDMGRTFAFSKSREHTEEINWNVSSTLGASLGLTTGIQAGVAGVGEITQEVSLEISAELSASTGGSSSDTESTTWEDSVSVTLEPGTVGRGRLLVTESKADVNFTQYVRVNGDFQPTFRSAQTEPKVCLYQGNPASGGTQLSCDNETLDIPDDAEAEYVKITIPADSAEFRIEFFDRSYYLGTTLALEFRQEATANDLSLISDKEFCRGDGGWVPTGFCYQKTESLSLGSTVVKNLWDYPREDNPSTGQNWWQRVKSFRVVNLSKPYACVYREGSQYFNGIAGGPAGVRRGQCFNPGGTIRFGEAADNSWWDFYEDIVAVAVSPGAELTVKTAIGDWQDPPTATDTHAGWHIVDFTSGDLAKKITEIQVLTASSGDAQSLADFLADTDREFELPGVYHSVYQTNAKAEAFSEPASYDACQCSSSYTELCATLEHIPSDITVKNLAIDKGSIECDGLRYKDRCRVAYPTDQQLDVLVKAIPYPGYTFSAWENKNGTLLQGTYSPEPGETIYAGFNRMFDSCDSSDGWSVTGTMTLDRGDKQEGAGSLQVEGDGHVITLSKIILSPELFEITEGDYLHLWLYVSHVPSNNLLAAIGIGSSGKYPDDTYEWWLKKLNLKEGWNELFLKIGEYDKKTGNPDLKRINFFKGWGWENDSSGTFRTYKIDDIYFLSELPISSDAIVLDMCDSADGWTGATLSDDKQEGNASLAGTDIAKTFDPAVHARVTENGYLHLWLYSDGYSDNGQIEMSSSGSSDSDEYNWPLKNLNLTTGEWNELYLKISNANETGGPADLSAINYFRLRGCTGTCRIDDLYFIQERPAN